mmetsp:Transcript_88004/g.158670  ORF Transcript_88004/g.158670 Transcript_88004/m.158670 type:complete len:239 (-) Transcript_88004:9-725(-)
MDERERPPSALVGPARDAGHCDAFECAVHAIRAAAAAGRARAARGAVHGLRIVPCPLRSDVWLHGLLHGFGPWSAETLRRQAAAQMSQGLDAPPAHQALRPLLSLAHELHWAAKSPRILHNAGRPSGYRCPGHPSGCCPRRSGLTAGLACSAVFPDPFALSPFHCGLLHRALCLEAAHRFHQPQRALQRVEGRQVRSHRRVNQKVGWRAAEGPPWPRRVRQTEQLLGPTSFSRGVQRL